MTVLRGRKVLITGAAHGIGLLMAERIAGPGRASELCGTSTRRRSKAACARIAAAGGSAVAYHCDLAERTSIEGAAARVLGQQGRVDVLINNAGVVTGRRLLETSDAAIERTFTVNTLALLRTVRAFLPGMLEAGDGHLVTIASASGIAAVPRLTDYSASKAAAMASTRRCGSNWPTMPRRSGPPWCARSTSAPACSPARARAFRGCCRSCSPSTSPTGSSPRSNDHAQLVMPPFVLTTYLLRLLPVADLVRRAAGLLRRDP